jgi:hypothetical protein
MEGEVLVEGLGCMMVGQIAVRVNGRRGVSADKGAVWFEVLESTREYL